MIIDCHCHAGKGDLLTDSWDTDAPIATQNSIARLNEFHRHTAIAIDEVSDRPSTLKPRYHLNHLLKATNDYDLHRN